VNGLSSPVDLQAATGDRTRLFVVEQAGRIRLIKNGTLAGTPFLDIASRVGSGGERGLLGLAFHPQYAQNGRFFVNYTDRAGDTHVAEFRVSANLDVADPGSERLLLFVAQPFSNHNGGGMVFANDGTLFLSLGDGGSGGDPFRNGQNLATHLGKILRIDVDRGTPYAVPADNPFTSTAGARPEIWAYGLRNPWRISVDRGTGDLYIGDVGQGSREEIDIGLASRRGGENYGWNVTEGTRCFSPSSGCNTSGLTPPVLDYGHDDGIAVTGGYVYRGCRMPGYQGTYFYGDYGTSLVRTFRFAGGQVSDPRDLTSTLGRGLEGISAFGLDADGEIHIVDYGGAVYKIVPN
jgi:glucose/arabinose dehydrogenase